MPRSSREDAARTRAAVASSAADLASAEGLASVSLGRIAEQIGISKSGVIGPFRSKEELQLATLRAAAERFRAEVWEPAADLEPGIERLRGVMEAWFSYLERDVFPGGCFLTAAAHEFDGRPGRVRDAIARTWELWLGVLEAEARTAQEAGALSRDRSARQVALELNALAMSANMAKQLHGWPDPTAHAREAAGRVLG
ncbi:MAG TPA: TetR/AcrR family transcriptional regulator [Thermoleophilaceae bacterium]|nr:TetR/AcrR family transcriptional regulator [Thermoleophilaceae bacterium]